MPSRTFKRSLISCCCVDSLANLEPVCVRCAATATFRATERWESGNDRQAYSWIVSELSSSLSHRVIMVTTLFARSKRCTQELAGFSSHSAATSFQQRRIRNLLLKPCVAVVCRPMYLPNLIAHT